MPPVNVQDPFGDGGRRYLDTATHAERPQEPSFPIVVIGASAGGVEALESIARDLPADLPAAVFVALHLPDDADSLLPEILDRAGPLRVYSARDHSEITPGTIVVAPADLHLAVDVDRTRLARGPRVNGHRPAIDVLFQTAARAHGPRVTGVVLTGSLSDGALGLREIKRRGGATIVQADPMHHGMPASALELVEADEVVPLRQIPPTLTMLLNTREEDATHREPKPELETGGELAAGVELRGEPSMHRCPECGGAVWELEVDGVPRFACHVGHTYSAESLLGEQASDVERALWTAARLLEERAALVQGLSRRMSARGQERSATRFAERARDAERHADVIRSLIEQPDGVAERAERGEAA